MKCSAKIIGCMTAVLFGATLAEGAFQQDERSLPRRLREEKVATQGEEREGQENALTPEQIARRQEASARIRARLNKWVVSPVKRLRPKRRPGPPSEEAAAQRRKSLQNRFSGLAPQRYPEGRSTDSATGTTTTNVEPAVYTTEETK